jgi:probable rRNA maturation factor
MLEILEKVIGEYRKPSGNLSFIITTDEGLLLINREFLKHNYLTDVIAFDYGEEDFIEGEIYISLDTIKANAHNYKVSLKNELLRVMIHGVLHICGFEDDNDERKNYMHGLEDLWLERMKGD